MLIQHFCEYTTTPNKSQSYLFLFYCVLVLVKAVSVLVYICVRSHRLYGPRKESRSLSAANGMFKRNRKLQALIQVALAERNSHCESESMYYMDRLLS